MEILEKEAEAGCVRRQSVSLLCSLDDLWLGNLSFSFSPSCFPFLRHQGSYVTKKKDWRRERWSTILARSSQQQQRLLILIISARLIDEWIIIAPASVRSTLRDIIAQNPAELRVGTIGRFPPKRESWEKEKRICGACHQNGKRHKQCGYFIFHGLTDSVGEKMLPFLLTALHFSSFRL